jgi:hypothetical protein
MIINNTVTAMIDDSVRESLALFSKKLANGNNSIAKRNENSKGTTTLAPMTHIKPPTNKMISTNAILA